MLRGHLLESGAKPMRRLLCEAAAPAVIADLALRRRGEAGTGDLVDDHSRAFRVGARRSLAAASTDARFARQTGHAIASVAETRTRGRHNNALSRHGAMYRDTLRPPPVE